MDRPMDETDRKHCLLDLHGVSDTADAEMFISKWRDGLEGILQEPPQTGDMPYEDMERDLHISETKSTKLESAIEDAMSQIADAKTSIETAFRDLEKATL